MSILSDGYSAVTEQFRKNSFLVVVTVSVVGLIALGSFTSLDQKFITLYLANAASINSNYVSFFGVLFGFLLTALSVLLSGNAGSTYATLVAKNKRYHNDLVGYFATGIVLSLFVVVLLLGLTMMPTTDAGSLGCLAKFAVLGVFYGGILTGVIVLLLLVVFFAFLLQER